MTELKNIINTFVSKMEDVNDKKLEICSREMNFAMQEVKAFNELRQSLHVFDKMELKEEISKRDKDLESLKKSQEDLMDKVQEIQEKMSKKKKKKKEKKDGISKD